MEPAAGTGTASPVMQGGGTRRQSLLLRLKELPSTVTHKRKSAWKISSKDEVSKADSVILKNTDDHGSILATRDREEHKTGKLANGAETYALEEMQQAAKHAEHIVPPDFVSIAGIKYAEDVVPGRASPLTITCTYFILIVFCVLLPLTVSISLCVLAKMRK